MVLQKQDYVSVARFEDLQGKGCITVHPNGKTLVLFLYGERVYALDNRCPHMGFPLDKGSVEEGILSCHWHHARFDLASGGAFDLWADDIDSYPVEVREGEIYVDMRPRANTFEHQCNRLRDGLQHNLSLVVAKAVINMLSQGVAPAEPFRIGLEFGTQYRGMDWGRGLTTHGCTMNLVPWLDEVDRPLALFHGLADVASDTAGMSPRFNPRPLPNDETDIPTLENPGSGNSSRCAMRKPASAPSSRPCAPAPMTNRSPICSSPPPPTTAISPPGIRWTSSTRRWNRSI